MAEVTSRDGGAAGQGDAGDLGVAHVHHDPGPSPRRGERCGRRIEAQDATAEVVGEEPLERLFECMAAAPVGQQGEAQPGRWGRLVGQRLAQDVADLLLHAVSVLAGTLL
jgi:hypothetical protein